MSVHTLSRGIAGRAALAAALAVGALWLGSAAATAEVVPGTERGYGQPPGGVRLTVDDHGSGNHALTLTWGAVGAPLPDDGYWVCRVQERSATGRDARMHYFDANLVPPTGGMYRWHVSAAPGDRIAMRLECRTRFPHAFATTPPSPDFGWYFDYQLR